MVDAYPLQWPQGWKRTERRQRANFGEARIHAGYDRKVREMTSFTTVHKHLYGELHLLGAKQIVLSTNLQLRNDGIPYANQKSPPDPGVAVYFIKDGKSECIPCDKWDRPEDNIKAIAKTIEALRGLDRWGSKDIVNAAFRGFQALPDYTNERPPIIPQQDFFADCIDRLEVRQKYLRLVRELHPDNGGDTSQFQEMLYQYERRMKKTGDAT